MVDVAVLPEEYAVCRLPAGSTAPADLVGGSDAKSVISLSWTPDELSIICPSDRVPSGATVQAPWRCLRVVGPLDLALTGTLAALVGPLAEARVNLLAFSTFDTDYLLVPAVRLAQAVATLTTAGHRVSS